MGESEQHDLYVHSGDAERSCARWLAAASLVIAYGSLIPFNLDFHAFFRAAGEGIFGLRWVIPPPDDLLINIGLYVPVGLVFGLLLGSSARILVRAIVFGAALSLLVERLQVASDVRVASWFDAALNGLGSGAGVLLASPTLTAVRRVLSKLRRTPFSTIAGILTAGIVVGHLFPMKLQSTDAALWEGFRRATWDVMPSHTGLPQVDLTAMARLATSSILFGVLGYLVFLSAFENAFRRRLPLLSAITSTVTLAALILVLQVLVESSSIDLVALVCRSIAGAIGALAASLRRSAHQEPFSLRSIPSVGVALTVAFYAMAVMMSNPDALCRSGEAVNWNAARLIPFHDCWTRDSLEAARELATVSLATLLLALPVAVVTSVNRRWIMAGLLVFVVTLGCTSANSPDPTALVLAMAWVVTMAALEQPLVRIWNSARIDQTAE